MHLKGLDLNLLVVLDALLSEKGITRTGERINLSQSATSGALARLREYFGDQLLIQVGQKMELTSLAERLAGPVHDIILKCDSLIEGNQGFRPETSAHIFRVNMSDSSTAVVLSHAFQRIKSEAPNVRVEISAIVDEPIGECLERLFLDLIVTPSDLISPLHPSEVLFEDQFVTVVWNGNPLIKEGMNLQRYLAGNHAVARFNKVPGWALDEVLITRTGYQRRIDLVTASFSMLLYQLIGSNLIATVPERFARCYAQYMPLTILRCPIPLSRFEVRLQWHRFLNDDARIVWFRKILHEASRQLLPLSPLEHSTESGESSQPREDNTVEKVLR